MDYSASPTRLKEAVSPNIEMRAGRQYVNPGSEDQMEIQGYRLHRLKQVVTWFGYLVTLGLLRLLYYWLPHLLLWSSYSRCSLWQAERVLLKDQYRQKFVSNIHTSTKDGTGVKIVKPKSSMFKKVPHVYSHPETDSTILKYFNCKKVKYIWDPESGTFSPLHGLDQGYHLSFFHNTTPLSIREQQKRHVLYGPNAIPVHVTPIIVLLFKQALSPFYIFQLFSVCVWYSDQYEIYASAILVVSFMSIAITIYQIRKFERALRNTISSTTITSVCRDNEVFQDIPSEDLVPGDVIEIPRRGCIMQCDAVLLTGNCIVNESMLTGESVPVTKTPLPNPTGMRDAPDPELDMTQHSRHILFCGTNVIQTRFYGNQKVKAVVLRTGYSTSKGELVRSILFPKPVDFKFQQHSYYFILVLAFIAGLGFIYTIVLMVNNGDEPGDIVLRTLDLITIAVPPALPAALAVGVVFSQRRLKHKLVYCISPRGINQCGTINTVCFDKTGTLTEDGLDMHGVVQVETSRFQPIIKQMSRLLPGPMTTGMATCHSLTIIDGQIMGDPLDLIMFNATGWNLEEPGPDETRFDMMTPTVVTPRSLDHQKYSSPADGDALSGGDVGIVRQFPFSSSLQRMSVVTRALGAANFDLFVKGSPEMIVSLSRKDTVPLEFQRTLQTYTQHGYRVIALAWKPLPAKLNFVKVQRINRDYLENDLIFLGLLVMENRLKPETAPVICDLREADIRTIMVTGDNMLTALSVARECKMVDQTDRIVLVQAYPPAAGQSDVNIEFVYADDQNTKVEEVFSSEDRTIAIDEDSQRFHFALTGRSWAVVREYCPELLNRIVVRGCVFARMSPDQKGQLVEVLQDVGYYVGMCGDGANDCGALKTAHMGISLSDAEASVASPFTSKKPTIECVPNVIKEGRAALVTSFGVFKYIACYSLTQFTSVLILYWIGANLTDYEFLYVDFFLVTSFSVTFSRTGPYKDLVKDRPLVSLLSPGPIISIVIQTMLVIAAQIYVFFNVREQPWFEPFVENEDDDYQCHENAAVFLISAYQYCVLALTFSKGAPFRDRIYTNWWLLINTFVAFGVCIWITMYPTDPIAELLELKPFPSYSYRALYIGVAFIFFVASYISEKFVVDNEALRHKCSHCLQACLPSRDLTYHAIESEINNDPNWPPVSDTKVDLAEVFQRLDSVHQIPPSLERMKSSLDEVLESDSEDTPIIGDGKDKTGVEVDVPSEPAGAVVTKEGDMELVQTAVRYHGNGTVEDNNGGLNTAL
ncbi:probable cation-transporting ATPase 13A3 [Aplysia californica]|uniref:Cation-transporting ATPase n=1 Tax=Aplysia californica TaxID=6500 RepID=A0ABM1A610_APLCA|nr:probable cation-transporting ATPase 13A3 [Aplysia californica]